MSYIGENLDDQFNIIKLHKNGGGGLNDSLIFLIGIKKEKQAANESSRVLTGISFYHFKFKLQ